MALNSRGGDDGLGDSARAVSDGQGGGLSFSLALNFDILNIGI